MKIWIEKREKKGRKVLRDCRKTAKPRRVATILKYKEQGNGQG